MYNVCHSKLTKTNANHLTVATKYDARGTCVKCRLFQKLINAHETKEVFVPISR